jgi:hypothetical protein
MNEEQTPTSSHRWLDQVTLTGVDTQTRPEDFVSPIRRRKCKKGGYVEKIQRVLQKQMFEKTKHINDTSFVMIIYQTKVEAGILMAFGKILDEQSLPLYCEVMFSLERLRETQVQLYNQIGLQLRIQSWNLLQSFPHCVLLCSPISPLETLDFVPVSDADLELAKSKLTETILPICSPNYTFLYPRSLSDGSHEKNDDLLDIQLDQRNTKKPSPYISFDLLPLCILEISLYNFCFYTFLNLSFCFNRQRFNYGYCYDRTMLFYKQTYTAHLQMFVEDDFLAKANQTTKSKSSSIRARKREYHPFEGHTWESSEFIGPPCTAQRLGKYSNP